MFCEIVKSLTIYENTTPEASNAGAWFPGVVRLPSGELYATFSTGDDFEGRMTMAASRSADDGASWRSAGAMFDGFDLGLGNLKPTLLADGTLICLGYGFSFGDDGLVNSATGGLAPGGNYVAFSRDGGRSWSTPQRFDTGHPEVLETSGPCVELRNGDLLAVGTPFPMWDGKMPSGRRGFVLRSTDKGRSWRSDGIFFDSERGSIAPYETRIVQQPSGRIVVMIWCLDEAVGKSLNNHVVFSDDDGHSWSRAIDTGTAGQASNLLPLEDGTLLAVHCVREGEDAGLFLNRARIIADRWEVLQSAKVWSGRSSARIRSLDDMGGNLKFGQPSLLRLADGDYLAAHWASSGKFGRILGHRLKINL